jgi:hypothetical protein
MIDGIRRLVPLRGVNVSIGGKKLSFSVPGAGWVTVKN